MRFPYYICTLFSSFSLKSEVKSFFFFSTALVGKRTAGRYPRHRLRTFHSVFKLSFRADNSLRPPATTLWKPDFNITCQVRADDLCRTLQRLVKNSVHYDCLSSCHIHLRGLQILAWNSPASQILAVHHV